MRDRPVLVLIHGFPQDHTLWNDQILALEREADLLTPDLLGFGTATELPTVMTMERYAEQLHTLLAERGVRRAVLCGLSMGGYVAMAFAERWPALVEALILSNTRATADTAEGKQARKATADRALAQGASVIARSMLPVLLSARTRAERPDLTERVERMMARQPANAVAAASLGMAERPDRLHVLRALRVPATIITGSEDTLMPLPMSQAMHEALVGSRLEVIHGTAHLPNIEAPDRFNAAVLLLLRSLPDA